MWTHYNYCYLSTQQFAVLNVALKKNVQLLTLVHVSVDGQGVTVKHVCLHFLVDTFYYCSLSTQLFGFHLMALENDVQLLAIVYALLDGQGVTVKHVSLHFVMDTFLFLFPLKTAICNSPCGTNEECTAPDTCTCVSGWKGSNCLIRMVTFSCGHILIILPSQHSNLQFTLWY